MSTRQPVFVIWDQTIHLLKSSLAVMRQDPLLKDSLHALGLDPAQGYVLGKIEDALDSSRAAIAVLDKHNANVGFEMGLALGRGLPLALVTKAETGAGWSTRAPFAGHLVQQTKVTPRKWRELIDQVDADPKAWNLVQGEVKPGEAVLLLWPEDDRGELHESALPAHPHRRLPSADHGWPLSEPKHLTGVGKVVWVVLQPEPDARDGEENARLAVVAGYARAVGIPLVILTEAPEDEGRTLVDIQGLGTRWQGIDALRGHLDRQLASTAPPPAQAPLDAYREALRARHASLIPFAPGMTETVLQRVVLELNLEGCGREDELLRQSPTLREVLEDLGAPGKGACGRLIVRAEPGAGKTTAARHVSFVASSDPDRIPVLVPLVELGGLRQSPYAWTEASFGISGLADHLEAAAKERGRVWLMLDGLDEVGEADLHELLPALEAMAKAPAFQHAVIVVLGRDVAFRRNPLADSWKQATLQHLSEAQQAELIGRLVPEDDRALQLRKYIGRWPSLRQLAQNPLMLSLFAVVGRSALAERRDVPYTRPDVYGAAVDLLLRGAHKRRGVEVKSVTAARRLLGAVAVELHERGGEVWQTDVVIEAIRAAYDADPIAEKWTVQAYQTASPEFVLADLEANGGLFGRLDGSEGLRFQHRSLREFLVAEGLRSPERMAAFEARWAAAVAEHAELERRLTYDVAFQAERDAASAEAARSGEVMGLRASIDRGPPERLRRLAERNPDALVRLLRTTEGLDPRDVVDLYFGLDLRHFEGGDRGNWDGDDLVATLVAAADIDHAVEEALWAQVKPERSRAHLGILAEALARVAVADAPGIAWGPLDRERFFGKAGIPLPTTFQVEVVPPSTPHMPGRPDILTAIDLPGGVFSMGSPEGVGDDREHPRQIVRVSPFALGQTAVTRAAWRHFDAAHTCPGGDDHPVTGVTWYECALFAAWLGGRLPTEAEWEYACRAGTDTKWSFGDDERELKNHAWSEKTANREVQPVARLAANPWGFHDMHGNTWEWCADGLRTFDAGIVADPVGPRENVRVFRGGSVDYPADWCRSAYRIKDWPSGTWVKQGLRVLFPAPAR